MTAGFAAKQKQLQNFLLSPFPCLPPEKTQKKLEAGKSYFKRAIDSDTVKKFSECTDKNKRVKHKARCPSKTLVPTRQMLIALWSFCSHVHTTQTGLKP